MKKIHHYFLLVLAFSFSTTSKSIAGNIILNPGFESSSTNAAHWTITGPIASMQPVTSIDPRYHFSGKSGLKMDSKNPNCHGRATQIVPVNGGQTYLFKARFKVKDVPSIDKSVMIKITWLNKDENLGYNYIYDTDGESSGWLLASNTIKAIEGSTSAEISLEFRWTTGIIWWDDISLDESAPVAPRIIKVATVYNRPTGPTVEKNISDMAALIDQAGQSNCNFTCLPEGWVTCNTGIGMQKNTANSIDGPAGIMLAKKAKQYGMYIISGQYSWIGDTLFNVAVLYDRKGSIQDIYKKLQLPDSESEQGAVPGNEIPVFTTDFGKIGILICWDYAFPEIARTMAVKGAEILFCPIWGDIRGANGDINRMLSRSRAVDNGVYFVSAIFDGSSMIINPAGDILQESNRQGSLLTASVDLNFNPPWDWIGNAGRGVWKGVWRKDRRGDLYGNPISTH